MDAEDDGLGREGAVLGFAVGMVCSEADKVFGVMMVMGGYAGAVVGIVMGIVTLSGGTVFREDDDEAGRRDDEEDDSEEDEEEELIADTGAWLAEKALSSVNEGRRLA